MRRLLSHVLEQSLQIFLHLSTEDKETVRNQCLDLGKRGKGAVVVWLTDTLGFQLLVVTRDEITSVTVVVVFFITANGAAGATACTVRQNGRSCGTWSGLFRHSGEGGARRNTERKQNMILSVLR
jgi:hypothetical protein